MAEISWGAWKTLKGKAEKAGLHTKPFDEAFGKKIGEAIAIQGKIDDYVKQVEKLDAERLKLEANRVKLLAIAKANAKDVSSTADKYKGKVTIQRADTPPKQAAAKEMISFLDDVIKRMKKLADA